MWFAVFFPFLISAIKERTEVEVCGCLDGLDGLTREGLGPLEEGLTAFARDGLIPLDMEGDEGRIAGVGIDRALAAAFASLILSDELEEPGLCICSELSSTEHPFNIAFPLSSRDIFISKSLVDLGKGLHVPSTDNLRMKGVPDPERDKDGVLLVLSPRSTLLFIEVEFILLGHRC